LMSVALGKPPSLSELIGTAMVIAALLIHTVTSRAKQVGFGVSVQTQELLCPPNRYRLTPR